SLPNTLSADHPARNAPEKSTVSDTRTGSTGVASAWRSRAYPSSRITRPPSFFFLGLVHVCGHTRDRASVPRFGRDLDGLASRFTSKPAIEFFRRSLDAPTLMRDRHSRL